MYFLQWHCHNQQNQIIVARSIKAIVETFRIAMDKEGDAKPISLIEGEYKDLPDWFAAYVAEQQRKQKICSFANTIIGIVVDAGHRELLKECKDCACDYDCKCLGSSKLPVDTTWEELYERAKTVRYFDKWF